jgi:DNA-binding transcriptional MerR regulator
MVEGYTIGQIASYAGVTIDTIRVYERYGLIEAPERRPNGYRHYPKQSIKRIHFIKWAQALGFTLKEVKELLSIERSCTSQACKELCCRVESRLDIIEKKLRVLTQFKEALESIIQTCDTTGENCPVLKALEQMEYTRTILSSQEHYREGIK